MRAAPVVEDDGVWIAVVAKVTVQFLFGSTATQIFNGRVDEPDTDVIFGAGPAVGGDFVLHRSVAVFVFDRIFVNARAHDALLLGMDDDTGAPIRRSAFKHVSVGIHRDPVKGFAIDMHDVTALAHAHRTVIGRMGKNGIGIDAAVASTEGVTDFDVAISAAAGRVGCEHDGAAGLAGDGNLGAFAAVLRGINGDGLFQVRRSGGVFLPNTRLTLIMAHRVKALVEERFQGAAAFVDDGLDESVVECPGASVVVDGHGIVDSRFGDHRRVIGDAQHRRGQWHGNEDRCKERAQAGRKKHFHEISLDFLQCGRARQGGGAGGFVILVKLKSQIVIDDAGGEIASGNCQLHFVFALLE